MENTCEKECGNPWEEQGTLVVPLVLMKDLPEITRKHPSLYFVQYKCANCGAKYFMGFRRTEPCPDNLGFADEDLACPVCANFKGWLKAV